MTDELSSKAVTQFVSTGPKSYSFKYGGNQQKAAIKGFTLNYENSNLLVYVKKQLREIIIINENKIAGKNKEIVNKYNEKNF